MIGHTAKQITIAHPDGMWEAVHSTERFGGPHTISVNGDVLLEAPRFHIDDIGDESAIVLKQRAFRKAGTAMATSTGYLPFGSETKFFQSCRYAANHVRITFDLRWRRNTAIRRHLGLGSLFLPGKWKRYFCLPPSLHLSEGAKPKWQDISDADDAPAMIGHWHRPPLALVFERADGTAVEIGTGYDLWRWEQCLGLGPENGSYKILREENGLRLVREPVMCCEEFTPLPRDYRFTWYAAWRSAKAQETSPLPPANPLQFDLRRGLTPGGLAETVAHKSEPPVFSLDLNDIAWPAKFRRAGTAAAYIRGENEAQPCWKSPGMQKGLRHAIRQLAGLSTEGTLQLRGVNPGLCWDSTHLGYKNPDGVAHWDINSVLDFAVWTRQQLGLGWQIQTETGALAELPSMTGLFGQNGFESPKE